MKSVRLLMLFATIGLTIVSTHAQQVPLCDVQCTPDPTSSSYGGTVAARPKLLNARGFSSPIQATAGPQQVPMILGSQSYNYVIPILSLPGRAGMDLSLNLYYNSRIWDIDAVNKTATFNADRDFPSYGFRLDFGYVEYDPNNDQYIATDRDGTKHALPNNGGYNSTDGTYINYNRTTNALTYKNGTIIYYQPFPSQAGQSNPTLFRPTQIRDVNGNYLYFGYVDKHDQLSSDDQRHARTLR